MKQLQIVRTLGELIDTIDKLNQKEVLWYRGHENKDWELIPSVQRPDAAELVLRNQMIEKREQEKAERKEKEHDGTTV